MAIGDDFSIAVNGDIRYTGTTVNYTVIAFHRWLGDLMDDAQANTAGNDFLDITDATASARSTDNIITLNAPYNIDNIVAEHLYDGSVIQKNGDEIYDGILVFANPGMYLTILQGAGLISPNFWTTALNALSTSGISHRFMVKTRTAGADIDGRRLVGGTREFGSTFSEFAIGAGTARGNNVLALTFAGDLNNATAEATIRALTSITNTTEGYKTLDVDNDTVVEDYYSEWNKAAQTINTFHERMKWLQRRATIEDSNADTANNFPVGNATLTGQAQSFANGVNAQKLTRAHFRLKKVLAPTGPITFVLYAHSGTFGTSSIPTGAALATSKSFEAADLTTAYQEIELDFPTPFTMLASTNYVIAVEHAVIDASNFVDVDGDTTGTHAGNQADETATVWTAAPAEDLWFKVFASPLLYGLTGEVFRGITHEVPIWVQSVTDFSAFEAVSWPGGTGQMLAIDDVNAGRRLWIQLLTGVAPAAGQTITGGTTGATTTVNNNTIATTAAAGTGTVATLTFGVQTVLPFPAGTTFTVAGVTPTAYNGTFVSTGGTTTTVTYASAATGAQSVAGTVQGQIVARTLSQPFVGQSTGSALVGAYGIGVELADLTSSDKLTDLTGVLRVPPNNVTFTVSGLVAGEDRVFVAPLGFSFAYDAEVSGPFQIGETLTFTSPAGTAYLSALTDDGTTGRMQCRLLTGAVPQNNSTITGGTSLATANVNLAVANSEDPRQLKLATTLNGAGETAVVSVDAIPTDTPSSGTIRVELDNGVFRLQAFNSFLASTFTIPSTSYTGVNAATGGAFEAGNSMFISYIDKLAAATSEAFTVVFNATRSLFVRVRDGGTAGDNISIKTFETTATLGSSGGSSTAIRNSDE